MEDDIALRKLSGSWPPLLLPTPDRALACWGMLVPARLDWAMMAEELAYASGWLPALTPVAMLEFWRISRRWVKSLCWTSARTPRPPCGGIREETTSYATFLVEVRRRSSNWIELNFLMIVDFLEMLC